LVRASVDSSFGSGVWVWVWVWQKALFRAYGYSMVRVGPKQVCRSFFGVFPLCNF
jgi:hypothetical protein